MGEPDESGFMDFAEGWNQTVKGWYHEAAGAAGAGVDSLLGDDAGAAESGVEALEGKEQAERGENLMGTGISEMLGRVDHGSATMPIQAPSDVGYDAGEDQVGDGQFDSSLLDGI
jgi:hypothetical protein